MEPGTLTIVPTPIGNLGDITLRALEALKTADIIACEDTRHSRRLFTHYEISPPRVVSLHAHNENHRAEEMIGEMQAGKTVALVSDAGMPGISDPGGRFLQACLRAEIPYDILPGASAVPLAVVGSVLCDTAFFFGGFLPPKSGGRKRDIEAALKKNESSLFYESPHRLVKTLAVLAELAPEHPICVARELSKRHQEYRRGTPTDLLAHYTERPPKGEIVLVIAGQKLPKWIGLTDGK